MKFRTVMMGVCAALAVVSVEPTTGLLKLSVALVGAAVGAVIADPVAEEAAEVKKQLAAIKEAVVLKREQAPVAAEAEG
jgi:Na+-transporting NADH:ubiquinone oxidoreductase subunit NqrD